MTNTPNGVETLPKISIARVHVTDDRQTDRQTDGRTTTYSELEFTFAKNSLRQSVKVRPPKQQRLFCYVTRSCAFSVL